MRIGWIDQPDAAGGCRLLVAYLAHEECGVSGNVYSVAGGRVAKIFIAETIGTLLSELTPEAVRDQLLDIDNEAGYHRPESLDDATRLIAAHIQG